MKKKTLKPRRIGYIDAGTDILSIDNEDLRAINDIDRLLPLSMPDCCTYIDMDITWIGDYNVCIMELADKATTLYEIWSTRENAFKPIET